MLKKKHLCSIIEIYGGRKMKHYEELLKKDCFTLKDAYTLVGNRNTANSFLQTYLKKGYIQSVKRNLYVVIDMTKKTPIANRYEIGSHVNESSYISHHSALAYYGYTNQVQNEVYVSSRTPFRSFNYSDLKYRFLKSRIDEGIVSTTDGVKVTDIERTVIDSINDFDKVGGLEELLRSLSLIPYLDEKKLLKYLNTYGKQILFQKTGYILEHFKSELNLSDYFFEICKNNIKKSIHYLSKSLNKDQVEYDSQWQLFVPKKLLSLISEGGSEDAGI